jgi:hypothetical protein
MPKEHMQRALEVLLLFAKQSALINVTLTAIGILWHVTDTLGRSRPSDAGDAARPLAPSASFGGGGGGGGGPLGLGVPGLSGAGADGGAGRGDGGVADHSCRHDMSDAEVTQQLLRVFTHLRQLSSDARPEVRAALGACTVADGVQ